MESRRRRRRRGWRGRRVRRRMRQGEGEEDPGNEERTKKKVHPTKAPREAIQKGPLVLQKGPLILQKSTTKSHLGGEPLCHNKKQK